MSSGRGRDKKKDEERTKILLQQGRAARIDYELSAARIASNEEDRATKIGFSKLDWPRINNRNAFLYLNGIKQASNRTEGGFDIDKFVSDNLSGLDEGLIDYIKTNANQNGFLNLVESLCRDFAVLYQTDILQAPALMVSSNERHHHFILNNDGSVTYIEITSVDFFDKDPTGQSVISRIDSGVEGRPLAINMTVSTFRWSNGFFGWNAKIKHELESDNVILLDEKAKILFGPKDKIIDRTTMPTADVIAEMEERLRAMLPQPPSIKKRVIQGIIAGVTAGLVIAGATLLIVGTGGVAAGPVLATIGIVAAKIGLGAAVAALAGGLTAAAVVAGVAIGAFFGSIFGAIEKKIWTSKRSITVASTAEQDKVDLRDEPKQPVPSLPSTHTIADALNKRFGNASPNQGSEPDGSDSPPKRPGGSSSVPSIQGRSLPVEPDDDGHSPPKRPEESSNPSDEDGPKLRTPGRS